MKNKYFGLNALLYKKTSTVNSDTGILQPGTKSNFLGYYYKSNKQIQNKEKNVIVTNYKIITCETGFNYTDVLSIDDVNYYTILEIIENRDIDNRLINTELYI